MTYKYLQVREVFFCYKTQANNWSLLHSHYSWESHAIPLMMASLIFNTNILMFHYTLTRMTGANLWRIAIVHTVHVFLGLVKILILCFSPYRYRWHIEVFYWMSSTVFLMAMACDLRVLGLWSSYFRWLSKVKHFADESHL